LPVSGLAQVERDHILHVLEASNWVIGGQNGAAERLGMKRTSLVYRMKKLRISARLTRHARLPSTPPQTMTEVLSLCLEPLVRLPSRILKTSRLASLSGK
jgi:hypothetical protein